mmetsp:Transcript_62522/g.116965  ORF Transcript_62522/g.116965 Transcript_62522/m.116965 type:complete len:95 (-) Transcript_62522:97-381(-)
MIGQAALNQVGFPPTWFFGGGVLCATSGQNLPEFICGSHLHDDVLFALSFSVSSLGIYRFRTLQGRFFATLGDVGSASGKRRDFGLAFFWREAA